jgi:hypothetical protein
MLYKLLKKRPPNKEAFEMNYFAASGGVIIHLSRYVALSGFVQLTNFNALHF